MGIFTYNGRKLQKRRYLMEDRRMSLDEWIEVYSTLADPKQACRTTLSSQRSGDPNGNEDDGLCERESMEGPDLIKQSMIVSCADIVTESLPPVLQFRNTREPYSGYIPSMASPDADVDTSHNARAHYGRQLRALAQQLPDNMYPISLAPDIDWHANWSAGSSAPLATIDEDRDEHAAASLDRGVWYFQQQPERVSSPSLRDEPARKPKLSQRPSLTSTSSASSSSVVSAASTPEVRLYGSCPTRYSE